MAVVLGSSTTAESNTTNARQIKSKLTGFYCDKLALTYTVHPNQYLNLHPNLYPNLDPYPYPNLYPNHYPNLYPNHYPNLYPNLNPNPYQDPNLYPKLGLGPNPYPNLYPYVPCYNPVTVVLFSFHHAHNTF